MGVPIVATILNTVAPQYQPQPIFCMFCPSFFWPTFVATSATKAFKNVRAGEGLTVMADVQGVNLCNLTKTQTKQLKVNICRPVAVSS